MRAVTDAARFWSLFPVAATLRERSDNDIENSYATLVDRAQDQGIKAVRAGASLVPTIG